MWPRGRCALRVLPCDHRQSPYGAACISACATPRAGQVGIWITPDMQAAYRELHRLGHAHSIEVFDESTLVGGLYGVAAGRMFFAESMFSARPGGSKLALAALAAHLHAAGDRKSVVSGKSVSVRVDLGCRRILNKKDNKTQSQIQMY